tara:strand:+ start:7944 stop:8480 length:537 start_codon:yes stop_codon:yes gene_type:complete
MQHSDEKENKITWIRSDKLEEFVKFLEDREYHDTPEMNLPSVLEDFRSNLVIVEKNPLHELDLDAHDALLKAAEAVEQLAEKLRGSLVVNSEELYKAALSAEWISKFSQELLIPSSGTTPKYHPYEMRLAAETHRMNLEEFLELDLKKETVKFLELQASKRRTRLQLEKDNKEALDRG